MRRGKRALLLDEETNELDRLNALSAAAAKFEGEKLPATADIEYMLTQQTCESTKGSASKRHHHKSRKLANRERLGSGFELGLTSNHLEYRLTVHGDQTKRADDFVHSREEPNEYPQTIISAEEQEQRAFHFLESLRTGYPEEPALMTNFLTMLNECSSSDTTRDALLARVRHLLQNKDRLFQEFEFIAQYTWKGKNSTDKPTESSAPNVPIPKEDAPPSKAQLLFMKLTADTTATPDANILSPRILDRKEVAKDWAHHFLAKAKNACFTREDPEQSYQSLVRLMFEARSYYQRKMQHAASKVIQQALPILEGFPSLQEDFLSFFPLTQNSSNRSRALGSGLGGGARVLPTHTHTCPYPEPYREAATPGYPFSMHMGHPCRPYSRSTHTGPYRYAIRHGQPNDSQPKHLPFSSPTNPNPYLNHDPEAAPTAKASVDEKPELIAVPHAIPYPHRLPFDTSRIYPKAPLRDKIIVVRETGWDSKKIKRKRFASKGTITTPHDIVQTDPPSRMIKVNPFWERSFSVDTQTCTPIKPPRSFTFHNPSSKPRLTHDGNPTPNPYPNSNPTPKNGNAYPNPECDFPWRTHLSSGVRGSPSHVHTHS